MKTDWITRIREKEEERMKCQEEELAIIKEQAEALTGQDIKKYIETLERSLEASKRAISRLKKIEEKGKI